jgi:cellulose synthase/poly-beta-1,6-N-acetylglucosamine synthase-like glycosyltransferase
VSGARPTVSVIICAYTLKRWEEMIASIASAVRQPEATEVIVVIDHEPELLRRTRRAWNGLTVVPNRFRQGLSGARNTGLEIATGEVVAFLDDDAVADDEWLRHLLVPFEQPEVVAVGGRALPVWPRRRGPLILPSELWWIVGCSYRGLPTERADVRNVMGCTMALRRDALRSIGGFNTDTGRVGAHPLGAEETEVCIRLRALDPQRRVVYEPASVVRHVVSADRVTARYLRRRSFFEGVSKAALSKSLGAGDALSTERGYTARVLPRAALREVRHLNPAGAAGIVLSLGSAGVGYLYGLTHRHTVPATVRAVPEQVPLG